jgi:chitodextrinase
VGLGSEIRWISQKAVSEHPCKGKAELPEVTAPPAAEAASTAEEASTTEEASTAEEEAISNWDSEKAYTKGEKVEVSGVTYEAQWWTKGENPTQSGEWGGWRVVDGQSSDQNQGGDDQNQGGDDQNQGLVK